MIWLAIVSTAHTTTCEGLLHFDTEVGTPTAGTVPIGFAVRPDGVRMPQLHLEGEDGSYWPLQFDQRAFWGPDDLPPGSYTLVDTDNSERIALDVVADWTPIVPADDLALVSVAWDKQWHEAAGGPLFCRQGDNRRHTEETLRFALPASEQPGWFLRVEDPSTNLKLYMGLHDTPRDFVWVQDIEPGGQQVVREDRCLNWTLFSPVGANERSGTVPCESRQKAPGCSSTGRGRTGLGFGALLIGLLLRRQGQSAQAS